MSQRQSTEMAQPGSEVQDTTKCNFFPCKLLRDVKSRVQQWMEQHKAEVAMLLAVIGALLYIMDVGTDIRTAGTHQSNGDLAWAGFTLMFTALASWMVVMLAVYQNRDLIDSLPWTKRKVLVPLVIIFFPFIGPILILKGYWDTLNNGWKSREYRKQGKSDQQEECYKDMEKANRGSARLRLIECFMEAAPQLALQVYIMTQISDAADPSKYNVEWWNGQYVTTITSWVSLAWGITAYTRTQREADENRNNVSLGGSIVIFLWRLSWLTARMTALVVFVAHFQVWVRLVVLGGHLQLMFLWLMVTRTFKDTTTNQSRPTMIQYCFKGAMNMSRETGLCTVFGFFYIFDFLPWNFKPHQPTRRHYKFYYGICEIENAIMVVMFKLHADPSTWYYKSAPIIHFVSFPLSLLFMGLYYRCLHPSLNQPPSQPVPQNEATLYQHIPEGGEHDAEAVLSPSRPVPQNETPLCPHILEEGEHGTEETVLLRGQPVPPVMRHHSVNIYDIHMAYMESNV